MEVRSTCKPPIARQILLNTAEPPFLSPLLIFKRHRVQLKIRKSALLEKEYRLDFRPKSSAFARYSSNSFAFDAGWRFSFRFNWTQRFADVVNNNLFRIIFCHALTPLLTICSICTLSQKPFCV